MNESVADDFVNIRARLDEIRRERETAVKGEPFGACWQCKENKIPCTGVYFED